MLILIVDDEQDIRTIVSKSPRAREFDVVEAADGLGGWETVRRAKPDAVISDVNMPVMDGITFIGEFRKLDRFTPVLVLTTESEESKIKAGKEAGASGWMVKPFKNQDMIDMVKRLVK